MHRLLALLPMLALITAAPLQAQQDTHGLEHAHRLVPISYGEALLRASEVPSIKQLGESATQLRGARNRVSSLPADLQLSAELGPRVEPRLGEQGRIGVAQGFSLGALGDARRQTLGARATQLDAETAAARLQRRLEVAAAYLEVRYAQASAQVAKDELELAEGFARVTAKGAELRELTRADAADAAAYAAEAKLALLSTEGQLADARFDLTRALSVRDAVLDADGDPPSLTLPSEEMVRSVRERIANAPQLAALLEKARALDAKRREVQASHASQLTLGVAADHADPSSLALLGTVSLTLPWQGRSEVERAELSAERRGVHGRLVEERADAAVDLGRLLHDLEHHSLVLAHLETTLLPAVASGLAAREALFRSGEGNALEVIVARRSALSLRVRKERARIDLVIAQARFAELANALGGGS